MAKRRTRNWSLSPKQQATLAELEEQFDQLQNTLAKNVLHASLNQKRRNITFQVRVLRNLIADIKHASDEYVEQRNELAEQHLSLPKKIAASYLKRLPANISHEELTSWAMGGLIQAASAFNPAMGYKFQTYANWKINGAILDELRSQDHLSRQDRTIVKQIERWTPRFIAEHDRTPTDSEIAEKFELSGDKLRTVLSALSAKNLSMQEEVNGDASQVPGSQVEETNPTIKPEHQLNNLEFWKLLEKKLSEREYQLVYLRFLENWDERDLAKHFEITKRDVEILLANALEKITTFGHRLAEIAGFHTRQQTDDNDGA